MKINFSVSRVGRRRGGHRQAHVHLHGHFKYPNVGHQSDATRVLLTLRVRLSTHWLCTNTSFIGWMALVCFITFFIQKKASLVEAIHFELSGMLSSWLRENIKCNIFLQPCNFEKIVRIMPQVTAMLPHHCKLTFSPDTIQRDQMQLSKIFSASTSNAIFWGKLQLNRMLIQYYQKLINISSMVWIMPVVSGGLDGTMTKWMEVESVGMAGRLPWVEVRKATRKSNNLAMQVNG